MVSMRTAHGTVGGEIWVRERPPDEDGLLLRRVASGDERALEEIYARFGRSLFGYLLKLAPDRRLAEEVLQDTLVAVWRGAGSYAGRSSAKTWIFGVCRRQAHNTLRRRDLMPGTEEDFDVLPTPDPGPEEALLSGVRQEELMIRLDDLSPLHREVLILFFYQNLSYEETATVLGVPVGTVKSRLSNAKRSLRTAVSGREEAR